jgi:hypothetical protein
MCRTPVITDPAALRAIDCWYSQPGRLKSPPAKVIAHRFGVSIGTLHDAATRKRAYAQAPRPIPVLAEAVMRFQADVRAELTEGA